MSYCCNDKFNLQEVGDSFQLLQGGSVTSVNGKVGTVVLDAGDIGYDGETTYPDASVGKELGTINSALSSLSSVSEIIDTASGAIASFPDGAGLPMRSLLATIEPQQEGSGDPAPDNIRPITGRTGLSGLQAGSANLFDETANVGKWIDASGAIINSTGTSAVSDKIYINSGITIAKVICVTGSGTLLVAAYDKNDNLLLRTALSSTAIVTMNQIPSGTAYIRFAKYNTTYSCCGYLNSTDVIREDFKGITPITVSWQTEAGTVYGGTVDVVSGVLTVDRVTKTLDGDSDIQDWQSFAGAVGYNASSTQFPDANYFKPILCNKLKTLPPSQSLTYGACKYTSAGAFYFWFQNGAFSSKADAKSKVAAADIQCVYYLLHPQTYQLTPQQISTLIGNNTVFVDTGDVSVTYQASIKGYIDKVLGS